MVVVSGFGELSLPHLGLIGAGICEPYRLDVGLLSRSDSIVNVMYFYMILHFLFGCASSRVAPESSENLELRILNINAQDNGPVAVTAAA